MTVGPVEPEVGGERATLVRSLGPCCYCGKGPARAIVRLPTQAPVPGTGWGCTRCGIPRNGALAVLCDRCKERGRKPRHAADGYLQDNDRRVPVGKLKGTHHHQLVHHPELNGLSKRELRELCVKEGFR